MKMIRRKFASAFNLSYVLNNGPWLLAGHGLSIVALFITSVVAAAYFPKEAFGTYRFFLSISAFIVIPSLAGATTALTQALARLKSGKRELFRSVLLLRLKFSLFGLVAGLAISLYYLLQSNFTFFWAFVLIAVFFPLVETFTLFRSGLESEQRFKEASLISFIMQLVSSLTLAAVFIWSDSPLIALAGYIFPLLIFRAVTTRYVYRSLSEKSKASHAELEIEKQGVKNYSLHLSLTNALGSLSLHLDKVLLFHFLGASDLAVYFFAITIPEQIKALYKNIFPLTLARFAQRSFSDLRSKYFLRLFIFAIPVAATVILYYFAAPALFGIFLPRYLDSIYYSQLFAFAIGGVLVFLPMSVLQSQRLTARNYTHNVTTAVVQILLLLTLFLGVLVELLGQK